MPQKDHEKNSHVPSIRSFFQALLGLKQVRYVLSGLLIFFLNAALMWLFIDFLGFGDTAFKRNLFHFVALEIALLFGFFLHDHWTWSEDKALSFVNRLLSYHAIAFVGILIRIFGFMLLDGFGVHWIFSTILPLGFVIVLNFFGFDRLSFQSRRADTLAGPSGALFDGKRETVLATPVNPYQAGAVGMTTLDTLENAKRYNQWLCDLIAPFLGECNVELGAGQGTLSAILSRSFPLVLTELSKDNRALLQSRFKDNDQIQRIGSELMDVLQDLGPVDCIYSSNVLEHIEQDSDLILQAAPYLRGGGYFVAIVPAMMWLYSEFDAELGHYRRYTKKHILQNAALRAKFSVLHLRYFDPVGAIGWFVRMRLFRSRSLDESSLQLYESLVPVLRILDRLPQPFGKNLLIVLQKK